MTIISVLSNIEAKEFDAPPVFNSVSLQTHHDEFSLADPKIMSLIHTRFWEQQTSA